MILDTLKNATMYLGMNKNLDTALNYISKTDLNSLPIGKTEIDGSNVYVNVSEYDTKEVPGDYEAHNNYADIQILLDGMERMDYIDRTLTYETVPYNDVKDVVKINSEKPFSPLKLDPTLFVVFFPKDAHRPNLAIETSTHNKKAVVKVRV